MTVLDPESTSEPLRIDPDEALRAAIKAALEAGVLERVKALVEILDAKKTASADTKEESNVVRAGERFRAPR